MIWNGRITNNIYERACMINIIDCSTKEFKRRTVDKRIFLFGAGTRAQMFYKYLALGDKVEAIVDNNEKLHNTEWTVSKKISIINLYDFIMLVNQTDISSLVLLVTPMFFAMDIIEQLNNCIELSGLECYIGSLLITHYDKKEFEFTLGEPKIPKKIHYCWFGKNEIPDNLKQYMKSWRKYCPDYEIVRWDESNYDITKNRYMYEAYRNKKWSFVSDCARLDIIYNEGGIYLDTDVELIASLDRLVNDEMFCGAISEIGIGLGLGFGASKHNYLTKELRDAYDEVSFYNTDGSLNLCPCTEYQAPILEKYGFKICNEYQYINGHVIYPSEVLSPIMHGDVSIFTERTVSIHHNANSWLSEAERASWNKFKMYGVSQ